MMIDNDFLVDKKIKEKLRKENNIVPQSIHQIIMETGSKLPKRRYSKSIIKYAVASLLIFTVGFTSLGVTNPAYAQNIPVIGSVFKTLNQMIFSNYDNYSSDLNISSIYNGYKITVNTVAYDGISLTMAYTLTSKSPLPFNPTFVEISFKINEKAYNHANVSIISGKLSKDKKTFNGIVETYISGNNYMPTEIPDKTSTAYLDIPPDKFNLKININSFWNLNKSKGKGELAYDTLKGDWNFNTFITNEKLKGKVKEIKTAINLDKVEKGWRINKLITTPLNTILLGTASDFNKFIGFIVYDNNGRELIRKGTAGGGMGLINYFMLSYNEIYKDTKALTFIPYLAKNKPNTPFEDYSVNLNLNGKTIIPIGKHGNLEITKVEVSNGKTNIYYKSLLGLQFKPENIVDKSTNEKIYIKRPVKYLKANHEYVVSIDTALKNKKYIIQCSNRDLKIFDDQKFTIAIK